MISMKAEYLSGCLKRKSQRLSEVAEQLASGQVGLEGLPALLREMEKDLQQLSKTAGVRSF